MTLMHNLESVKTEVSTPMALDDPCGVFPGENWFFYWKSGSGLWRDKLSELPGSDPIFVPIHWAFHCQEEGEYDFAKKRPETDLAKLFCLAREAGREAIFLLPVTPSPIFPNGGLPHFLARGTCLDKEGMVCAAADAQGHIHKLYSFFSANIFRHYAKFTRRLGHYLGQSAIEAKVWGLTSGYLDRDGFVSFLLDRSSVYGQAFGEFLQARQGETEEDLRHQEARCHEEFFQMIRQSYLQEAAKSLGERFCGQLKASFVGGGLRGLASRLEGGPSLAWQAKEFLRALCSDTLASSALISAADKKGVLEKLSADLVVHSLNWECCAHDEGARFCPLRFFEVYEHRQAAADWKTLGLWSHLRGSWNWTYTDRSGEAFRRNPEDEEELPYGKAYFFQAAGADKALFHHILRLFMNGGTVVINTSEAADEWIKKIERFFLENSLPVEKIKLQAEVWQTRLEAGKLILVVGDQLIGLPQEEQNDFWQRLIGTFKFNHIFTPGVPGVEIYWRSRGSMGGELNYEEIRRMGVYNCSSYKRRLDLDIPGNFKLLKIIDQIHVEIENGPHQVSLELSPQGSVSIDFGVFS